jgi:4-amino-4-deoxy-L-arabinose transferase-like glycosyltransferase
MGTVEWLFIVGGIVMIALAAGALGQDAGQQRNLDVVLAVLGVWSIVQAIVFTGTTLEWVSFATAAAAALLATVGLTLHEMTTERVVHELRVITGDERAERPARVS